MALVRRIHEHPEVGNTLTPNAVRHAGGSATHFVGTGPWRVLYRIEGDQVVVERVGHIDKVFNKRNQRFGAH